MPEESGLDQSIQTLNLAHNKNEQPEAAEPAQDNPQDVAYCAFSRPTKLWIVAMMTISGFMSPLSLNIYFPVLTPLSRELGVTVSLINLSITSYQIVQAVAPMFVGNFGDTAGRRPAFIISVVIYIGANIGLALQRSYAALMILRSIQSLGISGTLAQTYAVIADLTTVSHPPTSRSDSTIKVSGSF